MAKPRRIHVLFWIIAAFLNASAQDTLQYKQIGDVQLFLEIFEPDQMNSDSIYPAIVFYFGGGWNGGERKQFRPQAEYFAERGIICVLADYRTKNSHNVSPFECLKDAKSAIRYLRLHAGMLQIDPNRIVASGGSAGGHLAAATALVEGYNHLDDHLDISCKPNALALFNPVFDNGPGGYGYDRIDESFKSFSPLHNIRKGAPPTIIFLGTEDRLIPVETAAYYCVVMEKVGSPCELHLYEGRKHGFFNFKVNQEDFQDTMRKMEKFLQKWSFIF